MLSTFRLNPTKPISPIDFIHFTRAICFQLENPHNIQKASIFFPRLDELNNQANSSDQWKEKKIFTQLSISRAHRRKIIDGGRLTIVKRWGEARRGKSTRRRITSFSFVILKCTREEMCVLSFETPEKHTKIAKKNEFIMQSRNLILFWSNDELLRFASIREPSSDSLEFVLIFHHVSEKFAKSDMKHRLA